MTRAFKILSTILIFALLCSCTVRPEATPNPYEGMIQVNDGTGLVWLPEVEGMTINELKKEDFSSENGMITYSGDFLRGIDVSEHQHEIDWSAVSKSGMADFAFIRAGYRGYTEGGLFEDPWFRANIEGAKENGMYVGVYFFSQAISAEEAVEEAQYLLELIKDYEIDLPIVYDWEKMHVAGARTEGLGRDTLTDCAIAFCDAVESAGYESMIYLYPHLAYHSYDLSRLTDRQLWLSAPGEFPDFYYAHSWWQYSYEGAVPGIEGGTDLNLYFPNLSASETE